MSLWRILKEHQLEREENKCEEFVNQENDFLDELFSAVDAVASIQQSLKLTSGGTTFQKIKIMLILFVKPIKEVLPTFNMNPVQWEWFWEDF